MGIGLSTALSLPAMICMVYSGIRRGGMGWAMLDKKWAVLSSKRILYQLLKFKGRGRKVIKRQQV
jgi:hypothetical protein